MCILAKATEMTTGVWQQVKRSCSDKRSIYNEENKTKEKLSTLVNTIDNFFLLIYYKWWCKHCVILLLKWKHCIASPCHQNEKHAHIFYLHLLYKHLDISRPITAESLPLHIASSLTRTGNLRLWSTSC